MKYMSLIAAVLSSVAMGGAFAEHSQTGYDQPLYQYAQQFA